MKLEVKRLTPGQRVFWANEERALVARGFRAFWQGLDGQLAKLATLPAPWTTRVLCRFRPTRQLLRLGLHNLWPLADGSLVGAAKKSLLRCPPGATQFQVVQAIRHGNKPGFNGMCLDPYGRIYVGEYAANPSRSLPMGLYRSDNAGRSYARIYEFAAGEIRHIHLVQWDPFEQCLWMGTGDTDGECQLLRSFDYGEQWDVVGAGSQIWRALALVFTKAGLYWGTDAGSDAGSEKNYVVRFARESKQAQRLVEMPGPCHGFAASRQGPLLASTGVEGGTNERDRSAHLWASRNSTDWAEVARWRKDALPSAVQFGVVHFAHNLENAPEFHFTARGLAGAGEAHYIAQVLD